MEKTWKPKRSLIAALSCFSIIFCSACYEPIEGCLSFSASNYDVTADRACDSCCVFPDFRLDLDQRFSLSEINTTDTFVNQIGSAFVLEDYYLILSDFQIYSDEVTYRLIDTIESNCGDVELDNNYIQNDMVVITPNSGLVTIGKLAANETYTSFSFLLGLVDCVYDGGISEIDSKHKLHDIDSIYVDNNFVVAEMNFNNDLDISLAGKQDKLRIEKSIHISALPGQAIEIGMTIDFGKWLADIDFQNEDELTIKSKILSNANEAFAVIQ